MKKTTTNIYDILGISSAAICLVHCLIFPMLTILPLGLSHNPFIDLVFAFLGTFAVSKIIQKSNILISAVLTVSMGLIWISILSELFLDIHLHLIYFGGVGMIIGHLLNYKWHKKQNH
ncbi:MerC domain-containing protein [Flavobacterium hydrophilum]|uniref:MerC mercury resistance protein n=1 Tax=Flavobacterium hydrophilum TaxID=2211445 RepID=A0A2V4BZE2_9FLAO|nr:MerC domain-containing protein [Flavobacterium hydrophilum]PXY44418.1 MerC mercury resistance protein [Flavobacterium hydrophilum]